MVEGPKWCGKTTTSEQHAKSILYMDDPSAKAQNLHLAEVNIKALLQGETPRLIDEWELAPQLWDAARFEVDHREQHQGQFIFTGSAVPQKKTTRQDLPLWHRPFRLAVDASHVALGVGRQHWRGQLGKSLRWCCARSLPRHTRLGSDGLPYLPRWLAWRFKVAPKSRVAHCERLSRRCRAQRHLPH